MADTEQNVPVETAEQAPEPAPEAPADDQTAQEAEAPEAPPSEPAPAAEEAPAAAEAPAAPQGEASEAPSAIDLAAAQAKAASLAAAFAAQHVQVGDGARDGRHQGLGGTCTAGTDASGWRLWGPHPSDPTAPISQTELTEFNNKRPREEDVEEGGPDKKRASAGVLDGANGVGGADPAAPGVREPRNRAGRAAQGCGQGAVAAK